MSKFDLGGQVAGLSRKDAISAQASNAITNAGYLGGQSWIKTQLDAHKELFRTNNVNSIDGLEYVSFNSAKEGMVIPDGAFDFFDLTYDLTLKNVEEALVGFVGGLQDLGGGQTAPYVIPEGTTYAQSDAIPGFVGPLFKQGSKVAGGTARSPIDGKLRGFGTNEGRSGLAAGSDFIVNHDYRDCGFAGAITPASITSSLVNLGYKINGQNPPTDDSPGNKPIFSMPGIDSYATAFPKYSDATDAQTGMRYMVGLYNETSALSADADDKYVVKSISLKTLKSGVCQLILHCRKAQATTNVTINASGACESIRILKLNY
tara:strand:- start:2133 stop:3086 length:954 start_codon:yes stop_codon:yes gene_type:complete